MIYNEIENKIRTSKDSHFDTLTNNMSTKKIFNSESSLGVTKSIPPLSTSSIVDFNTLSFNTGTATIENISTDKYKISISGFEFNPSISVGVTIASNISISSTNGIIEISSPDFNLASVSEGDKFIFHVDENSPFSSSVQGVVYTITGIDGNKLYAADPTGAVSETQALGDLQYFSVYEPIVLDTYTLKLGSDFDANNQGYYGIDYATDKYVIIKSEKSLIEGNTTLTTQSLNIFSRVINFLYIESGSNLEIILDGQTIPLSGHGGVSTFSATVQVSSLSVKNQNETQLQVTVVYGTQSQDQDLCEV